MKEYSFVSKNGINIEVKVIGEYNDVAAKDFWVITDNGFDKEFKEVGDADEILDVLGENGIEFDKNPRHFAWYVINACMIEEEATLDQALDYQAKWEADQK